MIPASVDGEPLQAPEAAGRLGQSVEPWRCAAAIAVASSGPSRAIGLDGAGQASRSSIAVVDAASRRPLSRHGQAGDDEYDLVGPGGEPLMDDADEVAERPGAGCIGTMPPPTRRSR